MKTLSQVKNKVNRCTLCGLAEMRKNPVPGDGNFRADVIFVGEAPGRNEDMQGRPFVGTAGKKLSAAFEYAGMSRDSVYITNVVKCRPPGNRIPSLEEKEACHAYLQDEIQIINPKIICILGNTALNSILGYTGITKYRGKVIKKGSQVYFVTIHPAAAIYRRELLDVLKNDIKKLSQIITELKNGKDLQADIGHA